MPTVAVLLTRYSFPFVSLYAYVSDCPCCNRKMTWAISIKIVTHWPCNQKFRIRVRMCERHGSTCQYYTTKHFSSLVIFLRYYRLPSIWRHCSSGTDAAGCRPGCSYNRGHCGWHSPTSTEICWMLSSPWNCTEGMGCLFWVRHYVIVLIS